MAAPDHQVVPFGSVLNGFISDNSDLDTMVLSTVSVGQLQSSALDIFFTSLILLSTILKCRVLL